MANFETNRRNLGLLTQKVVLIVSGTVTIIGIVFTLINIWIKLK